MLLSDVSVKRPVFATVISLLLVAFGALSFSQLAVRELPDVDPPVVSVQTNYAGANSAIIETRITQIIEGAIAGVEGIKTIESTSRDGRSDITIEFSLDRDIDAAANDVRDRLARVVDRLPEQADPPEVSKADGDTRPIFWYNLASPVLDTEQLTDYVERNIVDRISVVDGVARIQVGGAKRYAVRIDLDRQKMAARGVTVTDVEAALRRENVELPAGTVESVNRDTIVRINREYTRPEQFAGIVIREGTAGPGGRAAAEADGSGSFVRLGDVADVRLGTEREQSFFRGNGEAVIGIGVVKQSQANTLEVAKDVRKAAERIAQTLPESMELIPSYDSSVFIEEAIKEVYRTLAISMGLVFLVLYLFLGNVRTVLVPAVTVPVCIIASFFVFSVAGISINLITLLALVLAIGLVVDDAIVVLENIYRRVEEGEPGLLAAYRGARQVGFAVIATTLVLIGVFVPIMFLEGNVGRLFGELAITMTSAVVLSSFVALTLSPMMCSMLVRRRHKKPAFAKALDKVFRKVQTGYQKLLGVCLKQKGLVIASFAASFVLIAALFPRVPQELAPIEDRASLFLRVQGPEGASFDYMKGQALKVEEQILPYLDNGELLRFLLRVDTGSGFGFIILSPWSERERNASVIAAEMRRKLIQNVPGMFAIPIQTSGLGGRGSSSEAVQFVIGANTYEQLGIYRDIILEAASKYPGLTNVDVDYKETQPQFRVRIDTERAADIGVSIQDIGTTLETMMGGRRVTTFEKEGEEYDVILQAERSDRQTPRDMTNIYVQSRSGDLVPLSNLVRVDEGSGAPALRRFNRVRALTLSANVAEGYSLGDAIGYLEAETLRLIPDATSIDYKGSTREFKESGSDIVFIFGLALLVVFLVLAAQFESFIHPFIIMLTVPLALLGGMIGLWVAGSTLNIYSQLGMIMLIGLAAKNGILIVEFANQLRDAGQSVRDALEEASSTRLRPILMTGLSTAMGAVPLIMASGAGSQSRMTIGVVVFGGVIISTAFTLFVVPVFYDMLARFTRSPGEVARQLSDYEEKDAKGMPAE